MVRQLSLAKYIEQVQANGDYWFTREHFLTNTKGSHIGFNQSAHRLSRSGKIFRFVKGFYVIIPIEYRNTGNFPPIYFIDHFMKYINQHYYVGLVSAASYYGFTHQQPQQLQIVSERLIHLGHNNAINIKFLQKKHLELTPIQKVKVHTGYVHYTTLEATALDLVQYKHLCGGWDNVATILAEMHTSLDPAILIETAKNAQFNITTLQRLGYLMETVEASNICDAIENYLQSIKIRTRYLSPECTTTGVKNRKWNLIINDQFEMDEI